MHGFCKSAEDKKPLIINNNITAPTFLLDYNRKQLLTAIPCLYPSYAKLISRQGC
jgi:hypothetical protein